MATRHLHFARNDLRDTLPGGAGTSILIGTSGYQYSILPITVTYKFGISVYSTPYGYRTPPSSIASATRTISSMPTNPYYVEGLQLFLPNYSPASPFNIHRAENLRANFSLEVSSPWSLYNSTWLNLYTAPAQSPNWVGINSATGVYIYTRIYVFEPIPPTFPNGTFYAHIIWGEASYDSYFDVDYTPAGLQVMSIKGNSGIMGIAGRPIVNGMTGYNHVRINKGVPYIVETGITTDPKASPLRIQTASGVRSLLKL